MIKIAQALFFCTFSVFVLFKIFAGGGWGAQPPVAPWLHPWAGEIVYSMKNVETHNGKSQFSAYKLNNCAELRLSFILHTFSFYTVFCTVFYTVFYTGSFTSLRLAECCPYHSNTLLYSVVSFTFTFKNILLQPLF